MAFLKFIGSQPGRIVRIAAGLGFIAIGISAGGGWLALALVGLLPLAAGVFDLCVLGPPFHLPFQGSKFRQAMVRR